MNFKKTNIDWSRFKQSIDLLFNDKPVHLKNFLPSPESYVNKKEIEKALNQFQVEWGIISPENIGINIPEYKCRWNKDPLQDKKFIYEHLKKGYTFIIDKYTVHSKLTKSLCIDIENNFNVNTDIHVYGSFGNNSPSFNHHFDNHDVMVFHVSGTCEWTIYDNKISSLISKQIRAAEFDKSLKDEKLKPFMQVVLEPGDFLYIPCRWYHIANPSQPRLSMSVACARNYGDRWDKSTYEL